MSAMNLSLRAVVDRPINEVEAFRLGQRAVEGLGQLASVSTRDERTVGLSVMVDTDDPLAVLQQARDGLVAALAEAGWSVIGWEALQALSPAEVDRRLENATIPPMVNTASFAELCGVSRQRISELETFRRAAAAKGDAYPFPQPVVPGWWLRSVAEHYAQVRKRKPGPESGAVPRPSHMRRLGER
jgi:hypothetical protein